MAGTRAHVVRPGECLASLAARYGLDGPDVLYDHPANAELRAARSSRFVLAPGDVVHVPHGPPPARVTAGAENRYCGTPPRVPLRLTLRAVDGSPLANARYALRFGASTITGTTTAEGRVEQEVDAEVMQATLSIYGEGGALDATLVLAIGHLDPIETRRGVRARLKNLGLLGSGARLDDAIARFQSSAGIEPTGTMDEATASALRDRHGC